MLLPSVFWSCDLPYKFTIEQSLIVGVPGRGSRVEHWRSNGNHGFHTRTGDFLRHL
jgi:hypothetical protein